ncbi:LuxR C-terminal-related transcriptional regulator [uncultured Gordonia sp.]|uniref:LuxR C-terminal-related transcriptional regulator n=1 Tax=uncultured Gordonia sp. TaxID=198437 RepID=UPI002595BEB1|nr:LuxR C-terminal-related transcriptional regulator [uncultured Gordonia sp.]
MTADRRAVAFSTTPVVALLDADGRPVPLRPAAHRALVLLLRHRHTGITRKDLVAGIWPGTRPQHPDAALRTVLSRLRERLPADCLHQTDGRIRLAGLAGPGHVPPPFVGRDAEIHELTRLLDTHDAVLVTGSFGVGKSRLLAELSSRGGRQPWRREIVTVPTSLHALHARSGAGDPVEALRRDLIAGEQLPTLVIADDIHRADPTVLEFLMALTDLGPVRLLAAAPTEDAVPDSITRHLRTSRWANLALGPLDGSAAAVLGRMVGARSDVAAAAGNPELICALARENVPGRGVVDAVRRRLSALPRDCADTLALVVLEGLLDWECIARLDALESITLLEDHEFVATDATGARPMSALVAGAVERSVTPAHRRRFAERLHAAATTPVMRATWGLDVGEPVSSADLLAASAFHLRSGDPDAAERFAGSAWASDPNPDAGFAWAHALALGTRPGHEIRSRLAGIRATSPLDTPSIAVAAAVSTFLKDADPDGARRQLRTISGQNHPLGQVAAALVDTYTGRPDAETPWHVLQESADPVSRGAAWAAWFLASDLAGDPNLATRLPDSGRIAAEGLADAQLHAMRARALLSSGDPDPARRQLALAASTTSLGDLRMRAWLATIRSELHFEDADFPAAATQAGRAAGLLARSRHRSDERIARHWLALTLAASGALDDAEVALADAERLPAAAVIGDHHGDAARALIEWDHGRPRTAAEWVATGYDRAARHGIADPVSLWVVAGLVAPPGHLAEFHTATATTARARIVRQLRDRRSADPRVAGLTGREREVLRMYARRLTADEIAAELGLATTTVRNHVAKSFRKLGIGSRRDIPDDV